jgi:putative hydrolase of the HAD superfamily
VKYKFGRIRNGSDSGHAALLLCLSRSGPPAFCSFSGWLSRLADTRPKQYIGKPKSRERGECDTESFNMDQKPLLIFDGDDTLWLTMPIYSHAKRDFFQLMRRQGFATKRVEAYFEERDRSNVKTLGFSMRRFGLSMQQTYRHFSRLADRTIRRPVVKQITTIRDQIFQRQAELAPFAKSVLQSLALRNRLVLLTKGTRRVQLQRVSTSGLAHFFEKVLVVKDKDNETFRKIAESLKIEPANTWSVGDSLRSDINPALRGGLNAIWIPNANWKYEEDVLLESKRFYRIQSLRQVIAIVNKLGSD